MGDSETTSASSSSSSTSATAAFDLEEGAILFSMFNDPDIELSTIAAQLDALAEEARLHHISDDMDVLERTRKLCDFLFVEKGFRGATHDYHNVYNSLIDKVLERRLGIPLTLALILHLVGKRVGLSVDMIGFPQHFLARVVTENGAQWYIDCFHGGSLRTREECINMLREMRMQPRDSYLSPSPNRDIFIRMCSNLGAAVHNSIQRNSEAHFLMYGAMAIMMLLTPHEQALARNQNRRILYTILKADIPEDVWFVEQDLEELRRQNASPREIEALEAEHQEILQMIDTPPLIVPKRRHPVNVMADEETAMTPPSLFRVGQVIQHSRYSYRGVIYGYDVTCSADELRRAVRWNFRNARVRSQTWIMRMGVDRLEHGRDQPFYNVLAEDGSHRYVAEQNIVILSHPSTTSSSSLDGGTTSSTSGDASFARLLRENEEIGKYFEAWDATNGVFVPNSDLRAEYPDDYEA
ncbi:hypothetical protein HK102_001160 [Quaeritorhiza haematococci]|nr:hypothetical protein HK102_001160 [Quaeritorhiza haematococci]